jgi:hypothetical protein
MIYQEDSIVQQEQDCLFKEYGSAYNSLSEYNPSCSC